MITKVQPDEMTIGGMSVPTIIVAAAMGSVITLFGVFLQNLFENHRNNKKLKQDIQQKKWDREMTLRRDVFLEAAAEMTRAVGYIAKFGDLDLPFREHQTIAEDFGTSMAKVHMIAKMETITKAVDASNVFATLNLELSQLRFSLQLDQKNLGFMQKSIEDDIAQQQNIVTRIGQLQTLDSNHSDVSALATAFQELESRIQQTRQRYSELRNKVIIGQLDLSSIVFKRTMSFSEKLIEVNVAFRKELDFDLKKDEETYRNIVHQSQQQAIVEIEKYIDKISKLMKEKRADFQQENKAN